MTTLITGGTGFVGQQLIKQLDSFFVTSRNLDRAANKLGLRSEQVVAWGPSEDSLDLSKTAGVDSVVNLMGESIAEGRWTTAKKNRICESRVLGTRKLIDALVKQDQLPRVFVSASAVGIYGDSGDDIVDERHPHGEGYLAGVCEQWEAETKRIADEGVRVVNLRIGIVIGGTGGALDKLEPIFKRCLGGRLGNGRQWMAWIHIADLVSLIQWSLATDSLSGPVNATAPNPVRNSEFTKAFAKSVGRPALFPAPKFAVRLALGEFADSLFFSQRVVPEAATRSGFQFKFPEIQDAIDDAIH